MEFDNSQPRKFLLEFLAAALQRAGLSAADVDDSFNLIETGLLDSIAFLNLVAHLEEHSGIEFDLFDVDPDLLTTVGGLVQLLTLSAPASARESRDD